MSLKSRVDPLPSDIPRGDVIVRGDETGKRWQVWAQAPGDGFVWIGDGKTAIEARVTDLVPAAPEFQPPTGD